jgi:uncharacterized glyoxalase superfamily protein PhnB
MMNTIPFLNYADAPASLDWLADAFGFERSEVHEGSNGTIAHAEMRFADGMIMLGSAGENDLGMKTAAELGAVNQGVYVIVDEGIDAHYERAVAAGAEVVRPIHDTDYGSRDYIVRDPEGNLWSFGTYRPG